MAPFYLVSYPRNTHLGGWALAALASLVLMFTFGAMSDVLYGTGFIGGIGSGSLGAAQQDSSPTYTQSDADFHHWNQEARETFLPHYTFSSGPYETDYSDAALLMCRFDRYFSAGGYTSGDSMPKVLLSAAAHNDYLNNVADDYGIPKYKSSCDRSWEHYYDTGETL
jgi:hypothetical protein